MFKLSIIRLSNYFEERENLTFELEINFDSFIKYNCVDVSKIFNSNELIDAYYDSHVINEFVNYHLNDKYNSDIVFKAEIFKKYYKLLLLYFCILHFIKKFKLIFNLDGELKRNLKINYIFPKRINRKSAFYYSNLLSRLLKMELNSNYKYDFYVEEFESLFNANNYTYYLETNYNVNLQNILKKNSYSKIIKLFNVTDENLPTRNEYNRCVALLLCSNKSYVSISGSSMDYDGKLIKKWFVSNDYKKVYKLIKTDVINYDVECHLLDNCLCAVDLSNCLKYKSSVERFIQNNYACCERKILAYLDNNFDNFNACNLYVKFEPCERCSPFLNGIGNIICADKNEYQSLLKSGGDLRLSLRKGIVVNSRVSLFTIFNDK